jgi:hypothetical protein
VACNNVLKLQYLAFEDFFKVLLFEYGL